MTTVARQGAKGIGMKWTLEDIDWDRFDPSKVDPMVLSVVRAASMVEYRSADYVTYLCNIFPDDEAFQEAARKWGEEENQHGRALGQWAKMADPSFDFDGAFADFRANYELALDAEESIRGTRSRSCWPAAWSKSAPVRSTARFMTPSKNRFSNRSAR